VPGVHFSLVIDDAWMTNDVAPGLMAGYLAWLDTLIRAVGLLGGRTKTWTTRRVKVAWKSTTRHYESGSKDV
jgi:hypothetical protein